MARARRPQPASTHFVTVDRDWSNRIGGAPEMTNRHMRALLLAMGRLEPQGHAHFERGELTTLLEAVNPDTGDLARPSARTMNRVISDLIEWGIFEAGSWVRCLKLPLFEVEYARADTGNTACPKRPAGRPSNFTRAA